MFQNKTTPVIFVHQGGAWYLPYALYQAAGKGMNNPVVLLGEGRPWKGISRVSFPQLESLPSVYRFRNDYVHMSTNSVDFELFCWLRWFILLAYMKTASLKEAVYLDSDVLLCTRADRLVDIYGARNAGCAVFVPSQDHEAMLWCASGHVSYWTVEALEQFCQFAETSFANPQLLHEYKRKWRWHCETKTPGGICDMTGLYWFWKLYPGRAANFAERNDAGVVDRAMGASANFSDQEYSMRRGVKETIYSKKQPSFITSSGRDQIRALALHFQGWSKDLMPFYYRGPRFPGKLLYDLQALWRFCKARLAWRLQ